MKKGTIVKGELISDSRIHNEPLTEINNQLNNLLNEIEGCMEFENLHAASPRLLLWDDKEIQYRINFTLKTIKPLSKTFIYQTINKVRAQKLNIN